MLSVQPMNVFQGKIAVIGVGSLGTSVIDALYSYGHKNIVATRRNQDKLREIEEKYAGITVSGDNAYAAQESNIIILGVKPKAIDSVCQEIRDYVSDKLVISLAAGVSIKSIQKALQENAHIARVMTGVFVSDEIAAYALNKNCTEHDDSNIQSIFGERGLQTHEFYLAHRTWIACDTGLIARDIGKRINDHSDSVFYAGMLTAAADHIQYGKTSEYDHLKEFKNFVSELNGKIEALELASEDLRGMNDFFSRIFYSATLRALAKNIRLGKRCEDIFDLVGGPGSYTSEIAENIDKCSDAKSRSKTIRREINRVVRECGG